MPNWKHHIKLYDLWYVWNDPECEKEDRITFDQLCNKLSERLMKHELAKTDTDNIEYFAEGFVEIGKLFKEGKTYEDLEEKFDGLMCEFYEYADEDYLLWIE